MSGSNSYNWDRPKSMQRCFDDNDRSGCPYPSLVPLADDVIPSTSYPTQDILDTQSPITLKAKEIYEPEDTGLRFTYNYGNDPNREPEVIDENDPRYPGFIDYFNELEQNLDVNGFERRGYMNLKEEEKRADAIAKENFDLKLSIYFLKEKLDSCSEEKLLELRRENKDHKSRLQSSELRLKGYQREVEEANEIINELDFKLKHNKCKLPHGMTKEQEEEYTFLTQETKLYQAQFKKMKRKFSDQQKELKLFKTAFDQFHINGSFSGSHGKIESQIPKDQAQINQAHIVEIEHLKGIIKGYEKRQLEDIEKASSLQKINEGLKFEIDSVYSEIDRYANLLSDSQKRFKKLDETKCSSNLISDQLEQETSFLSQRVIELGDDNNLLLDEISELEKEFSFVKVQYTTVYNDLVKFDNENKILKTQLEQVKLSKRNSLASLSSTQTGYRTRSPTSTLSVSVPNFHEFELESDLLMDLKERNSRLENITSLPCPNCGLTSNSYAPPNNESKSFVSADFSIDDYTTKSVPLSPQAISSLVFEIQQNANISISEILDKSLNYLDTGNIGYVTAYSSALKDKVKALEIFLQNLASDFQRPTFLDNQEKLKIFFQENSTLLNKIIEGEFPNGNILCSIEDKIESANTKLRTLNVQINNKESMMATLDRELETLIATLEQEELIHDVSLSKLFPKQYTPRPSDIAIPDKESKEDIPEQKDSCNILEGNLIKSSHSDTKVIISQINGLEKTNANEQNRVLGETTEVESEQNDTHKKSDGAIDNQDDLLGKVALFNIERNTYLKRIGELIEERDELLKKIQCFASERDEALKKVDEASSKHEEISDKFTEAISKRDECLSLLDSTLFERDQALKRTSHAFLIQEEISKEFSEAIIQCDEIFQYFNRQLGFHFKDTIQAGDELPRDFSQAKHFLDACVLEMKDFLKKEFQRNSEVIMNQFEDNHGNRMQSIVEKENHIERSNQAYDDLLMKYKLLKEELSKVKTEIKQFKSIHFEDQNQLVQLRQELKESKEQCHQVQGSRISTSDMKNSTTSCEAQICTAELDMQEKLEMQEKKYKLLKLKFFTHATECKAKFKVSHSLFTRVMDALSESPQRSNMVETLVNELENVKMLQQEHQQQLQINN